MQHQMHFLSVDAPGYIVVSDFGPVYKFRSGIACKNQERFRILSLSDLGMAVMPGKFDADKNKRAEKGEVKSRLPLVERWAPVFSIPNKAKVCFSIFAGTDDEFKLADGMRYGIMPAMRRPAEKRRLIFEIKRFEL